MYKPRLFAGLLPFATVAIFAGCQSETAAVNEAFKTREVSTPDEVDSSSASPESADAAKTDVAAPWNNFKMPSGEQLRNSLTDIQYHVTQEEGTEPAFQNKYWDNKDAGIYVDIVSGEPLFLSTDKYRSGTGWPSFVQPLDAKFIELREDNALLSTRTEVRSKIADSHVGHVFNDGPADRGGKRWCMNSAAMRFIPKDEMKAKGYGRYWAATTPPR